MLPVRFWVRFWQVLAGFNTRHNTPPFKSRHHTYSRIARANAILLLDDGKSCQWIAGGEVAKLEIEDEQTYHVRFAAPNGFFLNQLA